MIAENIQIENKLEKHGERNTYPSTKNGKDTFLEMKHPYIYNVNQIGYRAAIMIIIVFIISTLIVTCYKLILTNENN